MLRLTSHFIKNWGKRVGGKVTLEHVNTIIRESQRIQKGRKYKDKGGTEYTTLTLFWHSDLDLIIQVDFFRNQVVSLRSGGKSRGQSDGFAQPEKGNVKTLPSTYTPLTMHSKGERPWIR